MIINCTICTSRFDETPFNIDREVTKEEDLLEYNIEHGKGNFGGDMMLTQEQMEWIKGGGEDRSLWRTRHWPKTASDENVYIPYTKIRTDRCNERELQNIQAAMDAFSDNTCIGYYILTKMLSIPEFAFKGIDKLKILQN